MKKIKEWIEKIQDRISNIRNSFVRFVFNVRRIVSQITTLSWYLLLALAVSLTINILLVF